MGRCDRGLEVGQIEAEILRRRDQEPLGPSQQTRQGVQVREQIVVGRLAEGDDDLLGLPGVEVQLLEDGNAHHQPVGLEHSDPVGVALGRDALRAHDQIPDHR